VFDEASDGADRNPCGGRDDRLRLIPHGEIDLSGRGEFERVGRFGRRKVLDLDSGFFQKAFVPCDEQRNVVHVGEPVEHHRQPFRRRGGVDGQRSEQSERQKCKNFSHL
jgi:hypothetical protein